MNVAGYVRKSTDDEEKQLYTLEAQEQAIRESCASKSWALVKLFVDKGLSGTIFDRPQLQRLRQEVKLRRFDLVLMVNFDRIARDNADSSLIRKEFAAYGTKVAETSAPDMDSGTSTGKLVYGIKGVVAEFEHDMISERTHRAMKYAGQKGKHLGRPPLGYDIGPDGKIVINRLGEEALSMLRVQKDMTAQRMAPLIQVPYKKTWRLIGSIRKRELI